MMNINHEPSEIVNLFFSGKKLRDLDTFSKSDPYIVLFQVLQNGTKSKIGRTETIQDNLNPDFEVSFPVEYFFERDQKFYVEVYDDDGGKDDLIGVADFSLGEILGSIYNMKIYNLTFKKMKSAGKLIVRVEQDNDLQKFLINFKSSLSNIPSTGFFSSKETFLEFRKQRVTKSQRNKAVTEDKDYSEFNNNNDTQLVYRSRVEKGSSVSFMLENVKSSKFCDNDLNLPVFVNLMKYKSNGSHYCLGFLEIRLNSLITGSFNGNFTMVGKVKNKTPVTFSISQFRKKEIREFSDYLKGGLNLTQFIGIDFTASNGNPSTSDSLHFITPGKMNHYQRAILSLGEILEKYNKNGMIPCYGFGAKIDNQPTSFNFPLNLNPASPFLRSYGEMLQCYTSIFSRIALSGPTNFAPLIHEIAEYTKQNMQLDPLNYTVYVIMTDGAITDMEETISEIIKASFLAMSIIIIGIGNANFNNMDILDSDDVVLKDSFGNKAARDIVQFVPFNKFQGNPFKLREEVLAELPDQIVSYFESQGILPKVSKFN